MPDVANIQTLPKCPDSTPIFFAPPALQKRRSIPCMPWQPRRNWRPFSAETTTSLELAGRRLRVKGGRTMKPTDQEIVEGMAKYVQQLKAMPEEVAAHEAKKALLRTGATRLDGKLRDPIVIR